MTSLDCMAVEGCARVLPCKCTGNHDTRALLAYQSHQRRRSCRNRRACAARLGALEAAAASAWLQSALLPRASFHVACLADEKQAQAPAALLKHVAFFKKFS